MVFTYLCHHCKASWRVEKSILAPAPSACPKCQSADIDRDYAADGKPSVIYVGRPVWTYNDARRFKDCRVNGGPRTRIDPSRHGDLGSWNSPGEVIPFNKEDYVKEKKKRKLRMLGG
jgi:hypothetical protein